MGYTGTDANVMIRRGFAVACMILFSAALNAAPRVLQIDLDHVIHPLSAELVAKGVEQAKADGADAILIRLNTPGGLLTATQEVIQSIVGSEVPVVTFVSPSGGKAASAGFMILVAGDVAAMAPGTNTGAAHPVMMGGAEMDEVMKQKVENDAAAAVRAVTDKRGRNTELAEKAVTESQAFTEEEALEQNLIDIIADNPEALFNALDGREVTRFDGSKQILKLAGATIYPLELTYRQRMLLPLINPSIAFILLVLGALGLYVEFSNPGLIVPGVAGALSIIVGAMALSLLPINWAGAALILLGVGCFIAEAFTVTHGILSIGGAIAMVLGIVFLVDTEVPELTMGFGYAIGVTLPFAAITVFLLSLAVKSFRYKVETGARGMIGEVGAAKTAINGAGKVFVHGELWNAQAATPIVQGAKVRIQSVDGLTLHVEPVAPATPAAPVAPVETQAGS